MNFIGEATVLTRGVSGWRLRTRTNLASPGQTGRLSPLGHENVAVVGVNADAQLAAGVVFGRVTEQKTLGVVKD